MRRVDNLTGVRAVAALWVVLFHLNLLQTPLRGRLGRVVEHGQFGVDLFFVLSGFVLSLVYTGRMPERFTWQGYRDFLLRRLAKIYPLHLLTLLGMMALIGLAARLHYTFTAGVQNTGWTAFCSAFMLHALGTTEELSWNVPSWSVGAEWFAYASLFTPMVFLLRRVRTVYVAAVAAALLALLGAATPLLGEPWTRLDTRGGLRILPEFLCGYLLYRLIRGRLLPSGDALTAVGIAMLLCACYVPNGNLWLLVPAVMVLLAGLHAGGRVVDSVFGSRAAVALGDASYSIYLLQNFVLIAAKQIFARVHLPGTGAARIAVLLTVLFASAGFGLLCFRVVEEPIRLAILRRFCARRRRDDRQPPPAGPEAPHVAATVS